MAAVWDVERLIHDLDGCGRYQILSFLVVKGAKISIIWTMYAMAFNGQQPNFLCQPEVRVNHSYARNGSGYDNQCSWNDSTCGSYKYEDDMNTIVNEVAFRL